MKRTVQRHALASSRLVAQAMKPGTPIPGLNFLKGKEAPVALERSEYPEWVTKLCETQISLAKLRKMDEGDATDKEKMRYLKLTRKAYIKEQNAEAGAK